jgi:hypothetical protein
MEFGDVRFAPEADIADRSVFDPSATSGLIGL